MSNLAKFQARPGASAAMAFYETAPQNAGGGGDLIPSVPHYGIPMLDWKKQPYLHIYLQEKDDQDKKVETTLVKDGQFIKLRNGQTIMSNFVGFRGYFLEMGGTSQWSPFKFRYPGEGLKDDGQPVAYYKRCSVIGYRHLNSETGETETKRGYNPFTFPLYSLSEYSEDREGPGEFSRRLTTMNIEPFGKMDKVYAEVFYEPQIVGEVASKLGVDKAAYDAETESQISAKADEYVAQRGNEEEDEEDKKLFEATIETLRRKRAKAFLELLNTKAAAQGQTVEAVRAEARAQIITEAALVRDCRTCVENGWNKAVHTLSDGSIERPTCDFNFQAHFALTHLSYVAEGGAVHWVAISDLDLPQAEELGLVRQPNDDTPVFLVVKMQDFNRQDVRYRREGTYPIAQQQHWIGRTDQPLGKFLEYKNPQSFPHHIGAVILPDSDGNALPYQPEVFYGIEVEGYLAKYRAKDKGRDRIMLFRGQPTDHSFDQAHQAWMFYNALRLKLEGARATQAGESSEFYEPPAEEDLPELDPAVLAAAQFSAPAKPEVGVDWAEPQTKALPAAPASASVPEGGSDGFAPASSFAGRKKSRNPE